MGHWGPNLVRAALATPSLQLRWLCDIDLDRARAVIGDQSKVRAASSFAKVLDDPEVAAVAIATPAATHFDLASSALVAGKHVLVEKPMTASITEADKLAALAREAGLVLMCDHTYCYTPAVRQVRNMIRCGQLGQVQFVDSVRINLGIVQPDVDVIWDLAPHDLSILDYVLPDGVVPVAIAAHTADPGGVGLACLAHLSVWLSNGALAHAYLSWLSPTKIRTTVFGGSKQTIVWNDMNPAARLAIHDCGVDRYPPGFAPAGKQTVAPVAYRVGDVRVPALPEREALLAVMAEFADSVSARREPFTSAQSGLRVLSMLEAATQSAESGGAMVPLALRKDG